MLLKPLAGNPRTLSKHTVVRPNASVRSVWPVAQKRSWTNIFGLSETHVAFFCAPHFLHTSNDLSTIFTPVKAMLQNHCFYIVFVSNSELVPYFVFAPWRGLRARLVLAISHGALQPPPGSTYHATRPLFVLQPRRHNFCFCATETSKPPKASFFGIAKTLRKYFKNNENYHLQTSPNI